MRDMSGGEGALHPDSVMRKGAAETGSALFFPHLPSPQGMVK
jgi:hypothetical protein